MFVCVRVCVSGHLTKRYRRNICETVWLNTYMPSPPIKNIRLKYFRLKLYDQSRPLCNNSFASVCVLFQSFNYNDQYFNVKP